jgi:hypothetical protein
LIGGNTMSIRILVVTIGVVLTACAMNAQESTKAAKIERILALTASETATNQMFDQLKAMVASQVPVGSTPEQRAKAQALQGQLFDLMKSRLSADKLRPHYLKIYDEIFSDDEVGAILTFYESPAGRALISTLPVFVAKIMTMMQAELADFPSEIQRIIKEVYAK